jgi:hypothetical protein
VCGGAAVTKLAIFFLSLRKQTHAMPDPPTPHATPGMEDLHVSSLESDKSGAVGWTPPGRAQQDKVRGGRGREG